MTIIKDTVREQNVVWQQPAIVRADRETLNRHRSCIVWFTGLSGAGKSTLARGVETALFEKGVRTFVLDGDNVRHGLCSDLGFSLSCRKENIRRIGEVAKLMMESGVVVLAAFISPIAAERELVRGLVPEGDFFEIYCKASLATCETRDVKGLYQKARNGEIRNFTGIDSPYEPPAEPELTVDTEQMGLADSVSLILSRLEDAGLYRTAPGFRPATALA